MGEFIVGLDLGGTNLKIKIFNLNFETIHEERYETRVDLGADYIKELLPKSIQDCIDKANLKNTQIKCIGMGIPGLLDVKRGISQFSPNFPPEWVDVPIASIVEDKLHIPTFIDNDVRVNLYGEWKFGAGVGKDNVVLLTLGTGLGSGVVIDGRVLYGKTGSVGEVGHMNMYRKGRPCRCGSEGCLGRYVSALGIIRTFKEKVEQGKKTILAPNEVENVTAKMISECFDKGDEAAIETLTETGEILGFGLANVINLYNPELIIIGGGVCEAGDRLLSKTREIVNSHALEISRNACQIVTAKLGDSAGMIGAAYYATTRF